MLIIKTIDEEELIVNFNSPDECSRYLLASQALDLDLPPTCILVTADQDSMPKMILFNAQQPFLKSLPRLDSQLQKLKIIDHRTHLPRRQFLLVCHIPCRSEYRTARTHPLYRCFRSCNSYTHRALAHKKYIWLLISDNYSDCTRRTTCAGTPSWNPLLRFSDSPFLFDWDEDAKLLAQDVLPNDLLHVRVELTFNKVAPQLVCV